MKNATSTQITVELFTKIVCKIYELYGYKRDVSHFDPFSSCLLAIYPEFSLTNNDPIHPNLKYFTIENPSLDFFNYYGNKVYFSFGRPLDDFFKNRQEANEYVHRIIKEKYIILFSMNDESKIFNYYLITKKDYDFYYRKSNIFTGVLSEL